MTREQAIEILQGAIKKPNTKDGYLGQAIDMAIKALEQGPIIDKIRAEIIKHEGDCRLSVDEYPSCKQCTDYVFETIYGILDKYKAEQEET